LNRRARFNHTVLPACHTARNARWRQRIRRRAARSPFEGSFHAARAVGM